MAEAALSESIAPDKIFSRAQFYFNDQTDLLAEGGFSQVFKALLRRDPRRKWMKRDSFVAAKVLIGRRNDQSRLDQGLLRSLRKEAAILLSLKGHKNIVQLIGICEDPTCYALLLEYVSGGNLSHFVLSRDNTAMDLWENKLEISHQIADGMCHLHSQSPPVIHLDLKLSNVLFKQTGEGKFQCKITDFGLSKSRGISSQTLESSSRERRPAGTIAYIAPERYQGEFDVSCDPIRACKADVYSYGVILWQIMVRMEPFRDEPLEAVIREAIKGGTAVPRTSIPSETPLGYVDLMETCYSFSPDFRPNFKCIKIKLNEITGGVKDKRGPRYECLESYGYFLPCACPQRPGETGVREETSDLYKSPYYFGVMTPLEAENALTQRGNIDRSFLVRESTTVEHGLVVSVLDSDKISHYLVLRVNGGGYKIPRTRNSAFYTTRIDEYISTLRGNRLISDVCKRDDLECGDRLAVHRQELIAMRDRSLIFTGTWTPRDPGITTKKAAVRELREPKNTEHIEELLGYGKLLRTLHHPQIMKLLGVTTTGPRLGITTEFMDRGSLSRYLRDEGNSLKVFQVLAIAKQTAQGMQYLSEKMRIVHRKLTARNVLIGKCPIADVRIGGLSQARLIPLGKNFVQETKHIKFPIKWLAPETLKDAAFYLNSDVWSFGVLVSELVTHGRDPYPDLSTRDVAKKVCDGWRMPKPLECPNDTYHLMMTCWEQDHMLRPSFSQLRDRLDKMVMEKMTDI